MRASIYLIMFVVVTGNLFALSMTRAQQNPPDPAVSTTQATSAQKDIPALEPTPALKDLLSDIDKKLKSKDYTAALAAADTALNAAQAAKDGVSEAIAQKRRALSLEGLNRTDDAIAAWKSAADSWSQIPDGPGQVEALASAAVLLMNSHADEAKQLVEQAIKLAQSEAMRPLHATRALNDGAGRAHDKGQIALVQSLLEAALPLFEKILPDSSDVIDCLTDLGALALDRRDFDTAKSYYLRALDLQLKLAPVSSETAAILHALGVAAYRQNDLATAANYYKRELEVQDKLKPEGSLDAADSLNSLGILASQQRAFAMAEDYFKRSLAIRKRIDPDSLAVADSLNNLGANSYDRGDLVAAESYFKRALEIQKKRAPGSLDVAATWDSLGNVAESRGDLVEEKNCFKRALEIQKKRAPESRNMAASLNNLGAVASHRGDLTIAQRYFKRALEIQEKHGSESREVAAGLNNLGDVAYRHGNLPAAQNYYARALDIQEYLAPYSFDTAAILSNLGVLRAKQGHSKQALHLYQRAVNILEKQRGTIAGSDARSLFVNEHTNIYTALFDAYIALGQYANAFNTVERERGRSLMESLFEHQSIGLSFQVPKYLRDRQIEIDNEWNKAVVQRLNPGDKPKRTLNDARLQQIEAERRVWEQELHRVSPKYANLQYPQPLDLPAVKKTLEQGTLLLEYAINGHHLYLFTVTKTTFNHYELPGNLKNLKANIKELKTSLTVENANRDPEVCTKLYTQLLAKAQTEIDNAQRLLICPQKELWGIPFCALIDSKTQKYLIESKPIHYTISMNVYAQTIKSRQRPRSGVHSVVAFGDPAYRPTGHAIASHGLGGSIFPQVPITGYQASAICHLCGPGSRLYLKENAIPSKVFQVAGSAPYVHFAIHCVLDGRDPLASFLVLAPEPKRTREKVGMLTAYDVLERLHLDAKLVTLCACNSGAGTSTGTEGIIGLTRAFQYSGAQSVLSALWEVDPEASCLLFNGTYKSNGIQVGSELDIPNSFYGALLGWQSAPKNGKPEVQQVPGKAQTKDQALRLAQMAMITSKQKKFQNPRFWAVFSLMGDWK